MKKVLGIIMMLFIFVFSLSSCDFLDSASGDGVSSSTTSSTTGTEIKDYKIPNSHSYYEGKNYKEVEETLKKSGFENFEVERLGNLITGFIHKSNEISKMSVAGDEKFSSGKYDKDVLIKFFVYSYNNECPEGHELVKQTARESTCASFGLSADAYYCSTCDEYYRDSKGNAFDSSSNVLIAKKDHILTHVEGCDSSCSQEGKIEHYECEKCHSLFLDNKATKPISAEEVAIAKKEHTIVIDQGKRPVSVNEPGLTEGSHCSVCGQIIERQTIIEWEGCEEEQTLASELEKVFPKESAKRVAVTAITNYYAMDVFDSTGNYIDTSKFHNYSDTTNHPENYYMYLIDAGRLSYKSEDTWFLRDIKVRSYKYQTEHIINMYITFDGSKYITSHWADARNVSSSQKVIYESFSEAYEVFPSMIAVDRSSTAEAKLDHSRDLLKSNAYKYLETYLVELQSNYKVTVHNVLGVYEETQQWDGSWYFDVAVTFKHKTTGLSLDYRVRCIVTPNGTIQNFTAKEL